MTERYKVVITGGGTGGHLYPGIAVAEEIKKTLKNVDILFIGSTRGIEAKILPTEKYFAKLLNTQGVVGKSLMKKTWALFSMTGAFVDVYYFLRKMNPDVVIGTGGYVSFLPVCAAVLLGIPTIIHEQNSIPGVANKFLARFVDRVCVTYENSIRAFPKTKTYLTGNPVRNGILSKSKEDGLAKFKLKTDRFTVFIFGGSRGARGLNKTVVESLEHLKDLKDGMQFIHQTGEDDYEFVRGAYQNYGFYGMVMPFITTMAEAYAASNMVISRAGATTIAEITSLGLPAILIPYPYSASSHQELNAAKLAQGGAAVMIKEDGLSGVILADEIKRLYFDKDKRRSLSRNCKIFGRPDASKKVSTIAISLIKKKDFIMEKEFKCLTTTG
ncbi:MAG: undecaprenyldiphospho-muramoylpentapeptide beta-N-acetylglucosaminyltransferase [Candidatus Magnetoovum sp. WYHC-5]|nr:undecaprenyldiphospho-muramoylpentapeptide beta-N-acetylglucosaminyltransferase [Candidatus Magnetoovum sp. WYHC-5]